MRTTTRTRARQTDDPADCVRVFPAVLSEQDATVTLAGYDAHGVVRITIDVEEPAAAFFAGIIQRYVRWRFGKGLRIGCPGAPPIPLDQWMLTESVGEVPDVLLE